MISGTSLAAVVSTALASSYTYASNGFVDPMSAAIIAPVAVLMAPLGAVLVFSVRVDEQQPFCCRWLFSLAA